MLRVGIYNPVSVPRVDYALMHAFMGYTIYTNGVGVNLLVYLLGCGRPRIANEQKLDTPLSLCGHQNKNKSDVWVFDGHIFNHIKWE